MASAIIQLDPSVLTKEWREGAMVKQLVAVP